MLEDDRDIVAPLVPLSASDLLINARGDEWRHVFASVQSLAKLDLEQIDASAFDVVIVDEFHHAAAPTYRRLPEKLFPIDPGTAKAVPYAFLGPVDYVSHKGARPIAFVWKMRQPMPADFSKPHRSRLLRVVAEIATSKRRPHRNYCDQSDD